MANRIGLVNAKTLNVRTEPSTLEPLAGKLARGTKVEILEKLGSWYRINSDNLAGFVLSDYVTIKDDAPVADFLWEMELLRKARLEPPDVKMIPVRPWHTVPQKMALAIWNSMGGLLEILCGIVEVDYADAVAVMCVESGGSGFDAGNRMIIRFENHIFWNLWGENNAGIFKAHFSFNPRNKWTGHKFRKDTDGEWEDFHGCQDCEWKVFNYARTLDESAAINAISMGSPQIMGFNSSTIGYESAKEMFDNFSCSIRYQVLGLFDFLRGAGSTSRSIEALQVSDYVKFASFYNGPGQAPVYGARIEKFAKAFESLKESEN